MREGFWASIKMLEILLVIKFIGTIKNWQVCFRYLIFTLEDGCADSNFIHIYDLEDEFKCMKIQNFGRNDSGNFRLKFIYFIVKYISYNEPYVYAASDYQIQVLKVKPQFEKDGHIIDANTDGKIRTIKTALKIQAMLMSEF